MQRFTENTIKFLIYILKYYFSFIFLNYYLILLFTINVLLKINNNKDYIFIYIICIMDKSFHLVKFKKSN